MHSLTYTTANKKRCLSSLEINIKQEEMRNIFSRNLKGIKITRAKLTVLDEHLSQTNNEQPMLTKYSNKIM